MSEIRTSKTNALKLAEAEISCRQQLSHDPQNAKLHIELGDVLKKLGRIEEAFVAFNRAVELRPDLADAYSSRAGLLVEMKGFDPALLDYRKAIALLPEDISLHIAMIETLMEKRDFVEAERCCRVALELDSGSAVIWELLGRVLQTMGRFEESVVSFRRCLEIEPCGMANVLLAKMPGVAENTDARRLMDLLKNPDLSSKERAAVGFALGDILDKANRFDEAFAAYASANAVYKEFLAGNGDRFDGNDLGRKVDEMIETITPEYFRNRSDFGQKDELPVFVVGMPRSGTSLVEQILASHSKVFGAGELTDIPMIRVRLAQTVPSDSPRHWQRHWHRHLAKIHLAKLAMMGGDAARVVDKLTANILHLGLIATMFPNARVIFCHRDPRDTCLSCFFQQFEKNNLMFTYDLADCIRQYREQQRLTAHWKKVLPIQMLDVQYEDLVGDLENQSRRLIEFLGLDWESSCLEFHKTDRPILTRSVWQVRQPITKGSVGRWKHYEKHLEQLKALSAIVE